MYELWDAETGNVIGFFGTAAKAESMLSDVVPQQGHAVLDSLFVVHEDEDEESTLVAEGQAMLVATKRLSADEQASAAARRVG